MENFLKPDENGTLLNIDDEVSHAANANHSFLNHSNLLNQTQEIDLKGFPNKMQKLINGGDRIPKLMSNYQMDIDYPDRDLKMLNLTPRRLFIQPK